MFEPLRVRFLAVHLRLLSLPGYWFAVALARNIAFRLSVRRYALGYEATSARRNAGVTGLLLLRAVPTTLPAVFLLVGADFGASLLLGSTQLGQVGARLGARQSTDDYVPLLLATAAFGSTLLGLYFTTVSVVVSTRYARASVGVRNLVLEDPAGIAYTRLVGFLVAASMLLLAAGFIGYNPPALTLVLLIVVGVVGVLTLLFLGPRAFQLLDPVALSGFLMQDFHRWASRAAAARQVAALQQHYRRRAAKALETYRDLALMAIEGRAADQGRSLHQLLCGLWEAYAYLKPRIPPESQWFERRQVNVNWLRSDDSQIGMALNTGTPLPPTQQVDRLWVEREISDILRLLLVAAVPEPSGEAYGRALPMSSLARVLAGTLDLDATLLMLRILEDLTGDGGATVSISPPTTSELSRQQLLDAQGLLVVNILLGLRDAADQLQGGSLWQQANSALEFGRAPSRSPLGSVLDFIESLRDGLAFERRVEGRPESPDWWLRHMIARRLFSALDSALQNSIGMVESGIIAPAEKATDPIDASILASRGLEAINKARAHLGAIESALHRLASARAVKDTVWPARVSENAEDQLTSLQDRTIDILARHAAALADNTTENLPDLFGQSYFELGTACLAMLVDERHDRFARLFPAFHDAALRAHQRASLIAAQPPLDAHMAFVLVSNPIIDLMEISGYALICGELGFSVAWDACKATWDQYLAGLGDPAAMALAISQIPELRDFPAILPGDILRTSRSQGFRRYLQAKVGADEDVFFAGRSVNHPSPIVQVVATSMGADAHAVFVVDYLAPRFPPGSKLPRNAQHVADSLELRRRRGTSTERKPGSRSATAGNRE